ncbi:MAG: hypothetical protein ABIS21_05525 [Acidimicrobiales bacterium]
MRTNRASVILVVLPMATWLTACNSSPTAPDAIEPPPGTHQSLFSAAIGPGTGGVSVTPRSIPEGTFAADIRIRVRGARPNTTYLIQRAPEVGRALASDGVCQRALGLSPWSASEPAAPAFVTFPVPNSGPLTSLTTSASGDGSLDFAFLVGSIPAGTRFDVMFRLVDDTAAPAAELRSGCFTVTAL